MLEINQNEMSYDEPKKTDDIIKAPAKKSTFNVMIVGLVVMVGITAFLAGTYMTNMGSNTVSEEDLDHAIAKLELKLLQNRLPTQQAKAPPAPVLISADDDPVIGDPNAPITIVEFSDFECPFCARFNAQTLPTIINQYIDQGKVKLVFRDFPIQSIHPNSVSASLAAQCAHDQGKFREMHDVLFEKQKEWSRTGTVEALSVLSQYSADMGMDREVFDSCLNSDKYIDEIQNDLNDGRSYGVSGTPGFFIGNDHIGYVELKGAQPFESFKKIIDAQLDA